MCDIRCVEYVMRQDFFARARQAPYDKDESLILKGGVFEIPYCLPIGALSLFFL